jgi:hypothetical protein
MDAHGICLGSGITLENGYYYVKFPVMWEYLVRPNNLTCSLHVCEPGSSVSIVSGYGLDDRAIEVRSPAEAKGFFLYPLSRLALGPTQPPVQCVPGVLSSGAMRGWGETLTTHPIWCRGREWVGAIPLLPQEPPWSVAGLIYFTFCYMCIYKHTYTNISIPYSHMSTSFARELIGSYNTLVRVNDVNDLACKPNRVTNSACGAHQSNGRFSKTVFQWIIITSIEWHYLLLCVFSAYPERRNHPCLSVCYGFSKR